MRTFSIRRTALAVGLMAAALATSACGGTETGKALSSDTSTATASPSAAGGSSAGATDSDGTNGGTNAGTNGGSSTSGKQSTGASSSTGSGGRQATEGAQRPSGSQARVVTCTGDNTRVVVNRPARPINHLLLTATNMGSVACDLYSAPLLRFDDEQAATAIDDSTRQQSVIRLAPGQSAYASVVLMAERTGDDVHGRTTARLGVHFAARDASGSVGRSVPLALPADTYKTDDAKVTHWLSSLDEALAY